MGGIRFRVLSDLARMEAHPKITCPKCGHSAIYERAGLISLFHAKGWNPSLEVAGAHLRCSKCDHKGARVEAAVLDRKQRVPVPRVIWER